MNKLYDMKNKIDPRDNAYPTNGYSTGMNIRTAMAMDAMKGILAGYRDTTVFSVNDINLITENAVRIADKLIEKLNYE
jgi:hypothetical protein